MRNDARLLQNVPFSLAKTRTFVHPSLMRDSFEATRTMTFKIYPIFKIYLSYLEKDCFCMLFLRFIRISYCAYMLLLHDIALHDFPLHDLMIQQNPVPNSENY